MGFLIMDRHKIYQWGALYFSQDDIFGPVAFDHLGNKIFFSCLKKNNMNQKETIHDL